MSQVDYEQLLIKYIRHVGWSEGVTFVPHTGTDPCHQHGDDCGFTPEELAALREAEDAA